MDEEARQNVAVDIGMDVHTEQVNIANRLLAKLANLIDVNDQKLRAFEKGLRATLRKDYAVNIKFSDGDYKTAVAKVQDKIKKSLAKTDNLRETHSVNKKAIEQTIAEYNKLNEVFQKNPTQELKMQMAGLKAAEDKLAKSQAENERRTNAQVARTEQLRAALARVNKEMSIAARKEAELDEIRNKHAAVQAKVAQLESKPVYDNRYAQGIRMDTETAKQAYEERAEALSKVKTTEEHLASNTGLAEKLNADAAAAKMATTSLGETYDTLRKYYAEVGKEMPKSPYGTFGGMTPDSKQFAGMKDTELMSVANVTKKVTKEFMDARKQGDSLIATLRRVRASDAAPNDAQLNKYVHDVMAMMNKLDAVYTKGEEELAAANEMLAARIAQTSSYLIDNPGFVQARADLDRAVEDHRKAQEALVMATAQGVDQQSEEWHRLLQAITAADTAMRTALTDLQSITGFKGYDAIFGNAQMNDTAVLEQYAELNRILEESKRRIEEVRAAHEQMTFSKTSGQLISDLTIMNERARLSKEEAAEAAATARMREQTERDLNRQIAEDERARVQMERSLEAQLREYQAQEAAEFAANLREKEKAEADYVRKLEADERARIQMERDVEAQLREIWKQEAAELAGNERMREQTERELERLDREHTKEVEANANAQVKAYEAATKEMARTLTAHYKQANQAAREAAKEAAAANREAAKEAREHAKHAKSVQKGYKDAAKGLKDFSKHAKTAWKNMLGLGKSMSSSKKHTMDMNKAVQKLLHGVRTYSVMLRTRFRRMSVAAIFEDAQYDFQKIAKMDAEFNRALSSMGNAAKAFGAQLVAILEPIIEFFGPIVTRILDMMTAAADKANQFVAQLTGSDSYIKASKGAYDYAAALEEEEKKTKKTKKATDDLKATLLGFDQLNRMEGYKSSDSSDDDSEADADKMHAQYTRMKTDATALNDLAKKIHDAFKIGDFLSAGKHIAEGVNRAFEWIDKTFGWAQNIDKFTKAIGKFVDLINGFVHGLDGKRIGEVIADVGNTIVHGLNIILHDVKFFDMGRKLGDIVVNAVKDFHWSTLGDTLVTAINDAVDFGNGFLETTVVDELTGDELNVGQMIGRSLFRMITAGIDALRPEDYGRLIANLVNNFAGFVSETFADPDKYKELGTDVGRTINTALKDIDSSTMASAISNLAESFSGLIANAFGSIDFGLAIDKLTEVLTDKEFDWDSVLKAAGILLIPGMIVTAFETGLAALGAIVGGAISTALSAAGFVLGTGALIATGLIALNVTYKNVTDELESFDERNKDTGFHGFFDAVDTFLFKNQIKLSDGLKGVAYQGKTMTSQQFVDIVDGWIKTSDAFGKDIEITDEMKKMSEYLVKAGAAFHKDVMDAANTFVDMTAYDAAYDITNPANPNRMRGDGVFRDTDRNGEVFGPMYDPQAIIDGNANAVDEMTEDLKSSFNSSMTDMAGQIVKAIESGGGDIVVKLGDEEVARSSNRGNAKINSRANRYMLATGR